MLPVGDENPQINTPYVTYTLITLNCLAWFFLQGFGSDPQLSTSICQYGLIPADLFSSSQANNYCQTSAGWLGAISSMFMHGSWMHIIGNMWFLWVFGDNVEDSMGSGRFALFYILCGICAAIAQVISQTQSGTPMVGASGAIGGVMGAYIMLYPRVRVNVLFFIFIVPVPAVFMLGYWFLVQSLGGWQSLGMSGGGVAFWAHVGGFVAGAILIWLFKDEDMLVTHPHHGWTRAPHPSEVWDDPNNRQ